MASESSISIEIEGEEEGGAETRNRQNTRRK